MTGILIRKEIRTEITHRPRDDHVRTWRKGDYLQLKERKNAEDTTPGQDLDHGF